VTILTQLATYALLAGGVLVVALMAVENLVADVVLKRSPDR
jgi:hypothetical protein